MQFYRHKITDAIYKFFKITCSFENNKLNKALEEVVSDVLVFPQNKLEKKATSLNNFRRRKMITVIYKSKNVEQLQWNLDIGVLHIHHSL